MGILFMSRVINLKKNQELFQEGDLPDAMYVIQKGRLAITKKKGNAYITLAELKTGDLLGEMTFFDKSPRSAGAKAVIDNTEVIELPFVALDKQWDVLPGWVKSIVKAINGHLRQANIKIRQLERTQQEEKEVFSSHTITCLMSILGFVGQRYGEETPDGLLIPFGTLRNYTIQIFQQATHKMTTLCEVLSEFGYTSIENLGEGKTKLVIKNIDFIFKFVEFYNNQLFSEQAKKNNINELQLKTLKVAKHYGEKAEKNHKGFVKINVTEISRVSMKEMGSKISVDDVKSLSESGMLGDHSADGDNDYIEFEIEYISNIVPFWELVFRLKSFQSD
jgi:CRP/FNR family transcriptional regulator, cyclic AMP receptor protein